MPELDGLETTRAIRAMERETDRHTPILALTAHAMQGDRERCLRAGMDGYLSKPIKSSELLESIEKLVPRRTLLDPTPVSNPADVFDLRAALTESDQGG